MTARPISIFLLAVGLLWGLIVVGFIALLGGFFGTNPPRDVVLIVKGLLLSAGEPLTHLGPPLDQPYELERTRVPAAITTFGGSTAYPPQGLTPLPLRL